MQKGGFDGCSLEPQNPERGHKKERRYPNQQGYKKKRMTVPKTGTKNRNEGTKNGTMVQEKRNDPDLLFLALFWKTARKTAPKARIFYPCRTPKILGEKRETHTHTQKQGIPRKGNKEGNPQKARKRRSGEGTFAKATLNCKTALNWFLSKRSLLC